MKKPSEDTKLDIWIGRDDYGRGTGYNLIVNGELIDNFDTAAAAERVAEEMQREHDQACAQEEL